MRDNAEPQETATGEAAIAAALGRLPIAPTLPDAIPYSNMIPQIARRVALMARPRERDKAAERRLAALAKRAAQMRKLLAESADATDLPWYQTKFAREQVEAVTQIERHVETALGERARRSSQPKSEAEEIARELAIEYERLTGRRSTVTTTYGVAGGAFLTLVADVFAAKGVKANAEYCAREAADWARAAV